jgi:hypothetical protein
MIEVSAFLAVTAASTFLVILFIGLFGAILALGRKREWWMRWWNRLSTKERKEKLTRDPLLQMTVALWGPSARARRLRIAIASVGALLMLIGLIGWLITR